MSSIAIAEPDDREELRLLREAEVRRLTNIGKTKRRALIDAGMFPAPIKVLNEHNVPGRTSFWLSSEIYRWLRQQAAAHRTQVTNIAKDSLNGWLNRALNKGSKHPKKRRGDDDGAAGQPFDKKL